MKIKLLLYNDGELKERVVIIQSKEQYYLVRFLISAEIKKLNNLLKEWRKQGIVKSISKPQTKNMAFKNKLKNLKMSRKSLIVAKEEALLNFTNNYKERFINNSESFEKGVIN